MKKSIWSYRGFLAFVIVLVLNASVDIGHKITIQNLLIKNFDGEMLVILSSIVNALILLPFVFLFSPSGYLNDRYSHTSVVRVSSMFGVVLSLVALISYYNGWFYAAFLLTFLFAVQSAVYSPAKYALMRELVGVERLGSANGVVQAATIATILISALLFSVAFEILYKDTSLFDMLSLVYPVAFALVFLSLLEVYFAFKIPYIPPAKSDVAEFDIYDYLTLKYLKKNLMLIKSDNAIWLTIWGLALFWGVSQLVVAAFPAHYKAVTMDDNSVVIQAVLAMSAVGIIVGSVVAGNLSKFHIELGSVSIGAVGVFVSLIFFAYESNPYLMAVESFAFGFFGGIAIVPLNAWMQYLSPKQSIGRIIAGSNFIQNIVMLLFLATAVILTLNGIKAESLMVIASVVMMLSALYALLKLPQLTVRLLLLPLLKSRYRLFVDGLQNIPQTGGVLLLGNHISWIDWLVLQSATPRAVRFVMERSIYEQWYLRWFLKHFGVIPISSRAGKSAMVEVQKALEGGEVVALFPEGHISYNGQLGVFKHGFEMILKGCDTTVVPFYLHGLWGSTFSRATPHYKLISKYGSKRNIGVLFGKPMPPTATAYEVKLRVQKLSLRAWSMDTESLKPLHIQWLQRAKEHPFYPAVYDSIGGKLNRIDLLTAVLAVSSVLKPKLKRERGRVGIVLPPSSIGTIVNMSLLTLGKELINLNYTLDVNILKSTLLQSDIKYIITSKKFVSKLQNRGFSIESAFEGQYVIYVEDFKNKISKPLKAFYYMEALFLPAKAIEWLHFEKSSLDSIASILFSSGSEGTPKGIELTHKNILGNIKQVSALLNFQDDDLILNSLPIFHSFGLGVTMLMPLCEGVPIVTVADPTDTQNIGKMAIRYKATILFGTATFFRLYAKSKKLNPLMFSSVRMAIAGAEKLNPDIAKEFKVKFGVDIYEGYGATETSPVISVNMPDAIDPNTFKILIGHKNGSVGQPIPGTHIRIIDPSTQQELKSGEDGLITVGGVQVMRGYLNNVEKTEEVIYEYEGVRYYKTGDKGHLDDDGFLYIIDRYSRFAKIGGEMVSLGAVEEQLRDLESRGIEYVAVALPDDKKGEQIVLLHTKGDIKEYIKSIQLAPLLRPSKFIEVDSIPLLGSGKVDYKRAILLAKELL